MKRKIIIIIIILMTAIIFYMVWNALLLGTYDIKVYKKLILNGVYDNKFIGGILKSEQEVIEFKRRYKISEEIPKIDFNKYMWICTAPHFSRKNLLNFGNFKRA